jgi:hypothetical protein
VAIFAFDSRTEMSRLVCDGIERAQASNTVKQKRGLRWQMLTKAVLSTYAHLVCQVFCLQSNFFTTGILQDARDLKEFKFLLV